MRFKVHLKHEQGLSPLDILPLINIIFLLFIFFVFTVNFLSQSTLRLNLPKAFTNVAMRDENNIEIILQKTGGIFINGQETDKEGLRKFFAEVSQRKPSVLIKADSNVTLGKLVELWDLVRSNGITQINIATTN
ncbi:MAG: biopolymer transporter ExbD [Candidatus Omnitrophica bacterium]|nr:biopolymer transporter ExbD [Candidatus Omnitrophota bacterium]